MNTEETVAVLSAGIAFISMIITLVLFKLNYEQTKKINEISLQSNYFEKIFDIHLITGIPLARRYIRFQNDILVDTSELVDELTNLRTDALYFKYSNKKFYNQLKMITQGIEDYLMECGNKKFEQEEQAEVYKIIHTKVSELYEIINNAHLGI